MLHIFQSERSSASRGVPLFAPVMKAMHQLDGYLEAELVAARLAAAKSLFLVSPDGAAYDGDDFEDYAPILDVELGSITQFKPGTEIQPWSPDHQRVHLKNFMPVFSGQLPVVSVSVLSPSVTIWKALATAAFAREQPRNVTISESSKNL